RRDRPGRGRHRVHARLARALRRRARDVPRPGARAAQGPRVRRRRQRHPRAADRAHVRGPRHGARARGQRPRAPGQPRRRRAPCVRARRPGAPDRVSGDGERAARIAPRKRYGQHFLHDPIVIRKIVETIAPRRDDVIVEIGGGLGALTAPLLERVATLHVIEIDPRLHERLERLGDAEHRMVVHRADALEFDFGSLAPAPGTLRVTGNLPYNVSTPLLFRLLEYRQALKDVHVMLQKEVVTRMTGAPGSKDYGRLTVMLSQWMDIEPCFDIGPGAFSPPPRVRSTFVRLVPRAAPRF